MAALINILILEDAEQRIQILKLHLKQKPTLANKTNIVWVKNYDEFKQHDFNSFDMIIFDHDLAEEHYSGYFARTTEPTGHDAAKLLPNNINIPVIIWSMNTNGANNIFNCLKDKNIKSVLLPFSFNNVKKIISMIEYMKG